MPASSELYSKVYHLKNLQKSWETVRANGLSSQSDLTKDQIKKFETGLRSKLVLIQKDLKAQSFNFSKSRGVLIPRKNKDDRPLVVSSVENRIVQRAILNVLHKQPSIKELTHSPTSFGGVENRNVRGALEMIVKELNGTAKFFARSDIKSFFTKIPRPAVHRLIIDSLEVEEDSEFSKLLLSAITTELDNLESLGKKASLFPLDDTGVAQGSCLSPMLGNIFLSHFDKLSNSADVRCIRFVDDYIILGPSEKAVKAYFEKGRKYLTEQGLEVYDPYHEEGKGKRGSVNEGFEFLGCEIKPGRISPAQKSVMNIKNKIQIMLRASFHPDGNTTFADTLVSVRRSLLGWGNSYAFCNNRHLMEELNKWVVDQVATYNREFVSRLMREEDSSVVASRLGVPSILSCKSDPLYGGGKKRSKQKVLKTIMQASTEERAIVTIS